MMSFLVIFVTVLHLITLAMLFIATTEKSWWTWDTVEKADLWHKCIYDNNTETTMCSSVSRNDWLHSVQALMVLSVILCFLSFLLFLSQFFITSKRGIFCFSGLFQIFSGLSAFAAVLIYTFQIKEILQEPHDRSEGHFGFCYILAWVCVPLLFCSGVLYVHLRKKTYTVA